MISQIRDLSEGVVVVNTMIGLEDEEEEDYYDSRVPTDFHDEKWPCPKLRNNRPKGKDLALVWFMNEKRDEIAQHIDINRIPNKLRFASNLDDTCALIEDLDILFRFVRVRVKAIFKCHQCHNKWSSHHAWISFDMKEQTCHRK